MVIRSRLKHIISVFLLFQLIFFIIYPINNYLIKSKKINLIFDLREIIRNNFILENTKYLLTILVILAFYFIITKIVKLLINRFREINTFSLLMLNNFFMILIFINYFYISNTLKQTGYDLKNIYGSFLMKKEITTSNILLTDQLGNPLVIVADKKIAKLQVTLKIEVL